jgi:FkbM family methyltransferase
MDQNLIFDIGLHQGRDTEFYLAKGFKVVALEANPALARACEDKFPDQLRSGQLTIVNKALWDRNDETISFFVNEDKDDWSSIFENIAGRESHAIKEISISSVTLASLIETYGVPYYAKCDIEAADGIFARQLVSLPTIPAYSSVEVSNCDYVANLYSAGYDMFQIVNQQFHFATTLPNPAREGRLIDFEFDGFSSGLFGRELDSYLWRDFDTTVRQLVDLFRIKHEHPTLIPGWYDVHATTKAVLDAAGEVP